MIMHMDGYPGEGIAPRRRSTPPRALGRGHIHDAITHGTEYASGLDLRKEVRNIVGRVYVGDLDLKILYEFSHKEMSTLDVLDTLVMLGVVREVASSLVIDAQTGGLGISPA